ncbi:MAG: sterol desaturase family protein [Flavobacteriales bacterium]|nr:sterol desaturase family protein [Flavobacteriales bacterium]
MWNAFTVLIPLLLIGVGIEWYVSAKRGDDRYSSGNLMLNLAIGAMDQIAALAYLGLLYVILDHVYTHYRMLEFGDQWYVWVLAYVAVDLISYWYHRIAHRVNILWAGHVTHHSSERFNFSNGFRTSFFQGFNRILFWSVLPVFGFSPLMLIVILKVSGIYDFLMHNEYVPKLRYVEKILITPSLHRVHHGRNDIYIDKNYGSTFSIWDRMFGTYQEETERVEYGIKGNYSDRDPITAVFHYYEYLFRMCAGISGWKNKLKVFIMPPEWQPIQIVNGHSRLRGATGSPFLKFYNIWQMTFSVIGVLLLLVYKDRFAFWEFMICSGIVVAQMAKAAMVLNGYMYERFMEKEFMWLFGEALLILFSWMVYSNTLVMYVFFFLLFSLLLIVDHESKRKVRRRRLTSP